MVVDFFIFTLLRCKDTTFFPFCVWDKGKYSYLCAKISYETTPFTLPRMWQHSRGYGPAGRAAGSTVHQ